MLYEQGGYTVSTIWNEQVKNAQTICDKFWLDVKLEILSVGQRSSSYSSTRIIFKSCFACLG